MHRAHHQERGSVVATCLQAPCASPVRKELRCYHVLWGTKSVTRQERAPELPCGSCLQARPWAGRFWRRHVTEAPGPPPGRAPVSPRVLWLQTHLLVREGFRAATCPVALGPRACPCVPKTPDIRSIMVSPGTRCRQRIKCVCDRSYVVYDSH
jgi:hypothetical protein